MNPSVRAARGARLGPPRPAIGRLLPLLVGAALLLTACGQKGPLWFEGRGKDTPWPLRPAGVPADPAAAATTDAGKDGASGAPGTNADANAKTPQDAR